MSLTSKEIAQIIEKYPQEVEKAIKNTLPRKIAILAKNHFKNNFRQSGFVNGGKQAWKRTMRQSFGSRYTPLTDNLMRSRHCLKKCIAHIFLIVVFGNIKIKKQWNLHYYKFAEILLNYTSSSEVFVTLQSLIMNSLMKHEHDLFVNENAHEQCNGFRSRRWYSHGFEFFLRIPRSRSGNFYSIILGLIRSKSEERAKLFNLLYTKGITTKQIGEISETIYGRSYSKQQVSYLSTNCREDVEQWLNRRLSSHYLAIYIDATFITTRRDKQVSKEAYYHPRILEDGSREVLSFVNHPTEETICWKEELEALKEREVTQIDLVVSDALQGIENAVCAAFPQASHQFCVAHVKRQILNCASHKDKSQIAEELDKVFTLENKGMKSLLGYQQW